MQKKKLTQNQKNLMRRYLTWCYKTTKEDLDRIDRYFTQLVVDDFIIKDLKASQEFCSKKNEFKDFQKLVEDFVVYRDKKEARVLKEKFSDTKRKKLHSAYLYLQKRFLGIQKSIRQFLGASELAKITKLYEEEMTSRIFQAREH